MLVAAEPTRERLVGQLMLALYRSGRQADALAVYQRARTRLADELGLEPGPALRSLQAEVLEQAEGLEPGIVATDIRSGPPRRRCRRRRRRRSRVSWRSMRSPACFAGQTYGW